MDSFISIEVHNVKNKIWRNENNWYEFFALSSLLSYLKPKKIKNTKKYVKIKLSQNICQTDVINDDVIVKLSKFRIFCIFCLLWLKNTICKINLELRFT